MKVTIVTVCLNSEAHIADCIRSVNSQSHPDIEHVFVDGGSTDGTLGIIAKCAQRDKILTSEVDDGLYDAMNKGIKRAQGDVIGFLNSDDFYASNAVLSKVAELFEEDPSLDACYADLVYTDQMDTSRTVRYWRSNDFVPGSFSMGWCPPHPTFFVRRSVYERFGGFDLNYRIASDVELMMRFLEVRRVRVRYVPEVWVKMRMGGVSNKNLKNIFESNQEILRALRHHGLPATLAKFFGYKLLSRSMQFLQRPSI